MRAEEMVLRVPDGRSVAVLLNATLVHSEDGEVETFVVTMQDMAQLEELERLRAEFLAMVSYELRPPWPRSGARCPRSWTSPPKCIQPRAERLHDNGLESFALQVLAAYSTLARFHGDLAPVGGDPVSGDGFAGCRHRGPPMMVSKRTRLSLNLRCMLPVGPFRCLARMISARLRG